MSLGCKVGCSSREAATRSRPLEEGDSPLDALELRSHADPMGTFLEYVLTEEVGEGGRARAT